MADEIQVDEIELYFVSVERRDTVDGMSGICAVCVTG